MAAETWVNDAGVARQIEELWVNDNGTARRILELWVNDNGTARLIFEGVFVTLPNASVTYTGGSPAEFYLNSDGNRYTRSSSTLTNRGEWLSVPAFVGNYECRATLISGTLTSGTTGAWQSLSTTRVWTRGTSAGNFQTCSFTIEIRKSATAEVVATATITLTADRS